MPDDAERLIVFLEAKVNNFEKEMQRASGTATQSYGRMRDTSQRTTRQMETDMVRSTSRINQALASTSTQIGAMAKTFATGFVGGIAGAGLMGIVSSLGDVTKGIAAIKDEAARAGVTTKVFQEWKAVAEDARIPIDAMTDAFKELNIRADEFAVTGKGSAAEAFQRLGMSPADIKQKLKDPSNLLLELMQRTRALKDTAASTRIFDELLGGTGAEQMVRLLQRSDDEIRNIIGSANETGRVMSDEMIAKADELDRKFNRVSSTVSSNLKVAVVELAGILNDAANSPFFAKMQQMQEMYGKGGFSMPDNWRGFLPDFGHDKAAVAAGTQKQGVKSLESDIKMLETQIANLEANGEKAVKAQQNLAAKRAQLEEEVQAIIAGTGKGTIGDATAASVTNLAQVTVQATDLVGDYLAEYRQELALSSRERKIATETQSILNDASGKGVQISDDLARALATEKVARDEAEASSKRMTTQRDKETEAAKRQKQAVEDLQADLMFEHEQLFRSPIEQTVYTELRNVGVDINSDLGKQIASQIRINEEIQAQQDATKKMQASYEDVGETIRESLGGALSDVFSGGARSMDEFVDQVIGSPTAITAAMIDAIFEQIKED